MKAVAGVVAVLGVSAGVGVLAGRVPATTFYHERIAKEAVRELMNDPGSATFRFVEAVQQPRGGPQAVCGEVNGKNQFGAFAGFTLFYWNPTEQRAFLDPGHADTDEDYTRLRRERDELGQFGNAALDRQIEQMAERINAQSYFESEFRRLCLWDAAR